MEVQVPPETWRRQARAQQRRRRLDRAACDDDGTAADGDAVALGGSGFHAASPAALEKHALGSCTHDDPGTGSLGVDEPRPGGRLLRSERAAVAQPQPHTPSWSQPRTLRGIRASCQPRLRRP